MMESAAEANHQCTTALGSRIPLFAVNSDIIAMFPVHSGKKYPNESRDLSFHLTAEVIEKMGVVVVQDRWRRSKEKPLRKTWINRRLSNCLTNKDWLMKDSLIKFWNNIPYWNCFEHEKRIKRVCSKMHGQFLCLNHNDWILMYLGDAERRNSKTVRLCSNKLPLSCTCAHRSSFVFISLVT